MMTSVKCPKCDNLCQFEDGRIFSFCNKCGSRLERNIRNEIRIYDKDSETDENLVFAYERFDICSGTKVPIRSNHDYESFNFELERVMDELLTFSECMKDVYDAITSSSVEAAHRSCEICTAMVDKILSQFSDFMKEYPDFGMYDEMKSLSERYNRLLNQLSSSFSSKQKELNSQNWAGREEELAELKRLLAEAKERKTRIPFYNLQENWAVDNEIAELEKKINGSS